jgi:cation diffusion facilitator family transporter
VSDHHGSADADADHDHDHSHDHDHDHAGAHEHRGGLRGVVAEIFRPHRHDATDSIDSALEETNRGIRAVKISFAALLVTSAIQIAVVIVSGSIALLSDSIHNFSDALTAVPLFLAFRLSRRPPNRRYTYGYRRAEDLAGVFVVAMITLSSMVAGWQALQRLIHPHQVDHLGALLAAGIVGFTGNELVALFRIREGNAIGSAALVADGYHARTDGFTSLAVAVGAVGVWAGFDRADPIVGLGISVAIFAVLLGAARQIYYRLMDAVDPAIVDRVNDVARATTGVVELGATQARWLGHRLVADIAVTVDENLPVRGGHDVAEEVRHRLLHEVPHLDDANVHIDPAGTDPHQLTGHHRRP